jgi:hypothetical protein
MAPEAPVIPTIKRRGDAFIGKDPVLWAITGQFAAVSQNRCQSVPACCRNIHLYWMQIAQKSIKLRFFTIKSDA